MVTETQVSLVGETQGPYAPQGSTPLLPKLSVTSKVSAPTSHAWVGSLVHFRSSEDVTLLEFTSPIDREYRTSEVRINVCSTDLEHRLHFGSFRLPCGAYGPQHGNSRLGFLLNSPCGTRNTGEPGGREMHLFLGCSTCVCLFVVLVA